MKTKKEIREEYKNIKFKVGVYKIENIINKKVLIGSSRDVISTWNKNRFQLNFGSHPNKELQTDWNSFGADNFKFEIVSEIPQVDDKITYDSNELKLLEEMFLQELCPFDEKGYHKRK